MEPKFKVGEKVRVIRHAPIDDYSGNWSTAQRKMGHDYHTVIKSVFVKKDGHLRTKGMYYYLFTANKNGTWEHLLESCKLSNEERVKLRMEELNV